MTPKFIATKMFEAFKHELTHAVNVSEQHVWKQHQAQHVGYYCSLVFERNPVWVAYSQLFLTNISWEQVGREVLRLVKPPRAYPGEAAYAISPDL